jgi:hypothetical protein
MRLDLIEDNVSESIPTPLRQIGGVGGGNVPKAVILATILLGRTFDKNRAAFSCAMHIVYLARYARSLSATPRCS